MKTKVNNRSDEHLVVKSLNVLTEIKGGGISQIRDTVKELQNSQSVLAQQQSDYWSGIASDNVISPEEKKILYKEYQEIKSERPAILEEAQKAGIPEEAEVLVDYKSAYNALYNLLEVQLKVFDRMDKDTRLEDRDAFIQAYINYYDARNTLRSGTYTSASTYILDLSPEYLAIPCDSKGAWLDPDLQISVEVNLYKGVDGTDYAITRQAAYNGEVIGTWENNRLFVPVIILTEDMNNIRVNVRDATGISLSANLIISKMYQSDAAWTMYDMQLSDNAVYIDSDGNMDPTEITVRKVKRGQDYESETTYGKVTAVVDGRDVYPVNEYTKDNAAGFDVQKSYKKKMNPFYLTVDGDALMKQDLVMVFYFREDKDGRNRN